MTTIRYGLSSDAWKTSTERIQAIVRDRELRRVVEIGGGANPSLPLEFVERTGIEYTLLDISQAELDKAPAGYLKVRADICAVNFSGCGRFDFAFSRMLAEHVTNGERFHRNVYSLLDSGGVAFHFFPTLYAPPFVANYLLPERLGETLLMAIQPGRERSGKTGKFPAYYQWCRGPLQSQIARFERIGFLVEEYAGFFGHEPYYRKLPPVHFLHLRLAEFLSKHPVASLTSFAHVLLVKGG